MRFFGSQRSGTPARRGSRWGPCSLLGAVVLLAAVLRAYRLDAQSLWFDEGVAVDAATRPTVLDVVRADPTNPPLFFLLLHLGTRLLGDDLLALRAVAALVGLAAVPLAYLLGRALFNPRAGLAAALLAAGSAPLWWAAQEVRMYGLLAALVLLAALGWHRVAERPSRRDWLLLLGAELALLYSHSTGPVAALWLNAATLLAWLVQWRGAPSGPAAAQGARRDPLRPDWRLWLTSQAMVAALWSPWLVGHFLLLPAANQTAPAPPQLGLDLLARTWQGLWLAPWALVGREPTLAALTALLAVLTLALVPWRAPAARWLIVHVLLLVGGLLAALGLVGLGLHGRYLVPVVPLLLVALAGGVARLAELPRPGLRAVLPALALVPPLATGLLSVRVATATPGYWHDDARALVQWYAERLGPQDSVLAWAYTRDRFDLAYYWERLGVRARRVIVPEGADEATVAALLPPSGAVALNVWYAQAADRREMLRCLLEDGTARPPEQHTVNGMAGLLFAAPAREPPRLRPLTATFRVARVEAVGALPERSADRAACVPVRITLLRPTDRPLKAALVVRNALGWEIARADALFARADQWTSERLGPGEALTAYPLLRLPYGAPAGSYQVSLRLYDEGALSGYDLLDGDTPVGKELALGPWRVRPGADWPATGRATDLPHRPAWPVAPGRTLLAHDASGRELAPGDRLAVTLLWGGTDALEHPSAPPGALGTPVPPLVLAAADGAWRVEQPVAPGEEDAPLRLDWREFLVPAGARDGAAVLLLPDGRELARYVVRAPAASFNPPPFAVAVGARLAGVGELVGYTLERQRLDRGQPVPITLVWRAGEETPATSYTVFVQLLDASGRLIAQSDALPAGGARPTTGWRPGEYVVDPHRLTFHPEAAPGPARLIVGMYHAATGARVPAPDGGTYVTLPTPVEVQ